MRVMHRPSASDGRAPVRRRPILAAVIASQFAPPFMFSGVAVLLPDLGSDLGAGAASLGLIETLFLAGSLSFMLPAGQLADATDKRTLYKLGLLGFGLISLVIGFSSSVGLILVMRFLQGVSASMIASTGAGIVADLVPPDRRGRVFGISMGTIYSGLALGPVCAGLIVEAAGWRGVFFVGGTVLLAGAAFVERIMPSRGRWPSRGPDPVSVGVLVLAVLSLVLGTAHARTGAFGIALIGFGAFFFAVFLWRQRKISKPVLDVARLAENRPLRSALLVQLLLYMNAFCTVFMLSLLMQVTLGYPSRISGQVLAIGTVVMAAVSPLAGRFADRLRPTLISTFGVVAVAVSSVLGATLGPETPILRVAVLMGLQGLGFGLFASANITTIMNSVRPDEVGRAGAMAAMSRHLGMVSGMMVAAVLIAGRIGNGDIHAHPAELADIVRQAFSVLVVSSLLALSVAVGRRRRRTSRGVTRRS